LPKDARTHFVVIVGQQGHEEIRRMLQRVCNLRQSEKYAAANQPNLQHDDNCLPPKSKASAAGPTTLEVDPTKHWMGMGQWFTPEMGSAVAGAISAGGHLGQHALITSAEYAGWGISW